MINQSRTESVAVNKNVKLRVEMVILIPPKHQSFLWQTVSACWAQRLYVSPSLREQKIIVSLCVTSVWISTRAQILLLPWAYAQEEVSLHRRTSLVNCTWASHLHFTSGLLVGCKPRKHQSLGRTSPRACFALRTITIFGILNSATSRGFGHAESARR